MKCIYAICVFCWYAIFIQWNDWSFTSNIWNEFEKKYASRMLEKHTHTHKNIDWILVWFKWMHLRNEQAI